MVSANNNNRTVIALGTLGVGKSTLMNAFSASKTGEFAVGDGAESVTKEFKAFDMGDLTLIDTPGLNDVDIPLAYWGVKLQKVSG